MNFNKKIKDIKDLEDKLYGKLPVNREELFILVNSWGRELSFITIINNIGYDIYKCEKKECLPLENLDVSKIQDFSQIFFSSPFNGDLSKWDMSNCINFKEMFMYSHFSNDSLKNLDLKNIKEASDMFYCSKFCGDISNWINYENTNFRESFNNNKNFKEKYYPDNNKFLYSSDETKKWLDENLERIREINRPKDEIILDYFDFDR